MYKADCKSLVLQFLFCLSSCESLFLNTKTSHRVFRNNRYTNDSSQQICLIYVEKAGKFYTNT